MNWFENPESFQSFKEYLINYSGLGKDALHIHIALLIFVVVRLVWRRKGGWLLAWVIALAATLGGEYLDIHSENASTAVFSDPAHWHDIWNSMLWPTIFMLVGPWLEPKRAGPAKQAEGGANPVSGDLPDQPFE